MIRMHAGLWSLSVLAVCAVEAYAHWVAMLAVGAALALGWHCGRDARTRAEQVRREWQRDVHAAFDDEQRPGS